LKSDPTHARCVFGSFREVGAHAPAAFYRELHR
jgi:hypothetical protein